MPEFAELGPLFRSTAPVALTESEVEYVVNCVRHIFPEHVVFQFNVTNTVPEQVLEEVHVGMQVSDPDAWEDVAVVPADECKCNVPAVSYVCLRRTDPSNFAASTFNCSVCCYCWPLCGRAGCLCGAWVAWVLTLVPPVAAAAVQRQGCGPGHWRAGRRRTLPRHTVAPPAATKATVHMTRSHVLAFGVRACHALARVCRRASTMSMSWRIWFSARRVRHGGGPRGGMHRGGGGHQHDTPVAPTDENSWVLCRLHEEGDCDQLPRTVGRAQVRRGGGVLRS